MLLVITILLGVCLTASVVANFAFFNAASLQLQRAEVYERWILEVKEDVLKAFNHIKVLDDRQIFQKDDEVGVVFQDILGVVEKLNERTQEVEPEKGE